MTYKIVKIEGVTTKAIAWGLSEVEAASTKAIWRKAHPELGFAIVPEHYSK